MVVFINDEPLEIESPAYLKRTLLQIKVNIDIGIAVAINNQVIPKTNWENYELKAGEKVTIIRATQGG